MLANMRETKNLKKKYETGRLAMKPARPDAIAAEPRGEPEAPKIAPMMPPATAPATRPPSAVQKA